MQSATFAVTGDATYRPKRDKGGSRGYTRDPARPIGGLHPPYAS
jgi:hypothetical protein